MKDNVEKKLKQLSEKMFKQIPLESPSVDFTSSIMSQIEAESLNEITKYKPLISKKFWAAALIVIIAFLGFALSLDKPETTSWFSAINFSSLSNNQLIDAFSNLRVSKTVVYSIVFFGAMVLIQIPLLKNYFNQRIEL